MSSEGAKGGGGMYFREVHINTEGAKGGGACTPGKFLNLKSEMPFPGLWQKIHTILVVRKV